METKQMSNVSFKSLMLACGLLIAASVQATMVDALTDKSGQYIGPTVEENIIAMDTDKNGFVDVFEVRAFLEFKHGKGYKKSLLDRLEANAQPNSCGTTAFIEELVDVKP